MRAVPTSGFLHQTLPLGRDADDDSRFHRSRVIRRRLTTISCSGSSGTPGGALVAVTSMATRA